MTIQEMQEAILAAGWQFQEHVYNDGGPNCYVQFSRSKNPHVFGTYESKDPNVMEARRKTLGWGRFDRERCWEQAYQLLVLGAVTEDCIR